MATKIAARRRHLNGRGNGTEEHRRVILPGETEQEWATDVGPLTGSWERMGRLASQRRCAEYVEVPEGTIVIDYERRVRAYEKQGRAAVTVGIVRGDDVEWGLPYRRTQDGVVVDVDATRDTEACA